MVSQLVNADRDESELDFRLYLEESGDESWYDPAGDTVDGAGNDVTLVSSRDALAGRGLLWVAIGDPKAPRNWGPSIAKSSVKKTPGLLADSSWLQSRNSRSGSGSSRPNMSESKTNGGELAEHIGSALLCMTSPLSPRLLWHNVYLARLVDKPGSSGS